MGLTSQDDGSGLVSYLTLLTLTFACQYPSQGPQSKFMLSQNYKMTDVTA